MVGLVPVDFTVPVVPPKIFTPDAPVVKVQYNWTAALTLVPILASAMLMLFPSKHSAYLQDQAF
jgi:hypothetical protein